jgi:hypothetical protein
MDGRLGDALAIVDKNLAYGKEIGLAGVANLQLGHPLYRSRVYFGEHLEEVEHMVQSGSGLRNPTGASILG